MILLFTSPVSNHKPNPDLSSETHPHWKSFERDTGQDGWSICHLNHNQRLENPFSKCISYEEGCFVNSMKPACLKSSKVEPMYQVWADLIYLDTCRVRMCIHNWFYIKWAGMVWHTYQTFRSSLYICFMILWWVLGDSNLILVEYRVGVTDWFFWYPGAHLIYIGPTRVTNLPMIPMGIWKFPLRSHLDPVWFQQHLRWDNGWEVPIHCPTDTVQYPHHVRFNVQCTKVFILGCFWFPWLLNGKLAGNQKHPKKKILSH